MPSSASNHNFFRLQPQLLPPPTSRYLIVYFLLLSLNYLVNAINDVEFQVIDGRKQFIVRLDCKSCTCRVWDLDEIPCAHALAVLRGLRPVGNHANWKSIGIENNILPPTFKRRAGRPRKQRILSIGEKKSHSRCSHCHRAGHNRRNCKFPPFLQ
ncbi:MuDRA-like transposase [Cucumis melo var. makuwa]|uniref:MuDRA-like transposase n=1 Tax=Cucumis melo var. makuwa TaxID=1194695 RepID=A0A5D3DC02_CUCMM|nr:MuDRA-like transposase [Cucumis melo var. makuwa]